MGNNLKQNIFLRSIALALIAILYSCGIYNSKNDPYRPRKIIVNVSERAQAFTDSLVSTGVDTIFSFSKECSECYFTPYIPSKKEILDGVEYSSFSYVLPTYIFWSEKGIYHVKRIDQFNEYHAVKRWKHQQIGLYDYLYNNADIISSEQYIFELSDTTIAPNYSYPERIDTLINRIVVDYYHPGPQVISPQLPLSNQFTLEANINGKKFKKTISEDYFTPVSTPEFEAKIYAKNEKNNNRDTVIVGNNKSNYQLNWSMKIVQLKQMIESELLDIEMTQLWVPQTTQTN